MAYMTFGVLVSFVLDPLVSWIRNKLPGKRGGGVSWFSKYEADFKLAIGLLVASILISVVVVYGFNIRPSDPSTAFQLGFVWNTVIDKFTGKTTFSSAKA